MKHPDVTIDLVWEDPRYPTLVVQGQGYSIGYSLDVETGGLERVCICHAHSATECVCGAWK